MAKKIFCTTSDELILKYNLSPKFILGKNGEVMPRPKEDRKVYLRGKAQTSGNVSLVLYTSVNGGRERIATGNVLNIEKKDGMTVAQCKEIETRNQNTIRIAEALANKYDTEAKFGENGFKAPKKNKAKNLCEYISELADEAAKKSGSKKGYYKALHSLKRHITAFSGENITFKQANREYVKKFLDYLRTANNFNFEKSKKKDTGINQNTQNRIYRNLSYVFNHALKDEIITENPLLLLSNDDKPKAKTGTREFLNVDDVKKLINTPCKQTDLKNAFIFCCLTGLRFSDISTLNWGKIKKDGNDLCVRFVMQKTQKECVVYISNEAKKWLPKKGKSEDLVFNLANNFNVNKALNKWASNARVEKNVTFHVARHTAATLNLSLGNSIEVVSEMLGHSSIKTTQIYAKVLAESQKRMAAKQNGLFD